MYSPIPNILPREIAPELQDVLSYFSNTLDEVVNYGTHILKGVCDLEYDQSDTLLPTIMFFRSFLEKADSISVLIQNSCADPSHIILRTLFETYLQLSYLHEKHHKDRAIAFLVWNAKNIITKNKLFQKGSIQHKELLQKITKDDFLLSPNVFDNSPSPNAIIENYENLLKKPDFERVEKAFKKAGKYPNWYSLWGGPKNIQQLASNQKLTSFYEILYRHWSNSVHGTDIISGKIVKSNDSIDENGKVKGDIFQLRLPNNAQHITGYSIIISTLAYKNIIAKFLPNKTNEFNLWYRDIRKRSEKITGSDSLINIK